MADAPQRLPPLYRKTQQLLRQIEEAVRLFPRYHKYCVGSDLRRDAMKLMRCMHRAVYERDLATISAATWAVDELKLTLQLAREVGAFGDMRRFAAIAELAADVGRQCGGWRRHQQQSAVPTQQQAAAVATPVAATGQHADSR